MMGDGKSGWEGASRTEPAGTHAKPIGWVVRAENGNTILWGDREQADAAAAKYGRPVEPLYVLSPRPADGWCPTHQHVRRGSLYRVLARDVEMQTTAYLGEGAIVTVYEGQNGRLWVRRQADFDDGRFERLSAPSDEPGAVSGYTDRAIRDHRQCDMLAWAQRVFPSVQGGESGFVAMRARRFLEEAVELAQAAGVTAEEADAVRAYVFSRPAGDIRQEIGGVMVTLSCLAEVMGHSVAEAEHA